MTNWTGRTLSKVEIQHRMGRGGMADVYLGRHTTLERPVAVKILHAHLSEDDMLLARFRDEAQSVAALRHPNIVQIYDFDVANDNPYIVMEYIEGPSLSEYLAALHKQNRLLPPQAITRIIEALAAALDYAHERGIVHRDVKPSNVMLRSESGAVEPGAPLPNNLQPVLADFGVARIAGAGGARTATGSVIGTPAYMSPEQVRGEPVDARSDIYALGIMLYEMLAGRAPFDPTTESTASILVKQMSETPPPLPTVSPEVQAVIDRALAKDRGERVQTAGDLASALNAALTSADGVHTLAVQPPAAAAAQTAADAGGFKLSKSIGTIVGIGVVLGLIFAGIVLLSGTSDDEDIPAQEITQVAASESTETSPATNAPINAPVASEGTSPDQFQSLVLFRDDTVTVNLAGVDLPPEGLVYEAWLTDPETDPLSLGIIEISDDGSTSLSFTDPADVNLTGKFSGFLISLEPTNDSDPSMSSQIAFQGQIDTDTLQRLRSLDAIIRGQPFSEALLDGLATQKLQYNTHLGLALDSINAGNLSNGKLHSEHATNIVEGRASENFADWNGDGRTENPGDDVGLGPYLLILADAAQGVAAASESDDTARQSARDVATVASDLALLTSDSSAFTRRVTAADTINEMQALVADMTPLRETIADGIDSLVVDAGQLDLAIAIELTSLEQ